jgi:DNA processing protein
VTPPAEIDLNLLPQLRQTARERKLQFIDFESPQYPALLKEIPSPPLLLFYRGNLDLLAEPLKLAMVGTRYPTSYGISATQKLAQALSDRGVCVVSGLARGIDAAAHEAVLQNSGKTIGVLGQGFGVDMPQFQKELFYKMLQKGLLLSEYWPEQGPAVWTYPKRNRIIAGLSRGTVVIEGRFESGAMITGKMAVDFNREVFALPGLISNDLSEGPHWLIQTGAKLVHGPSDIFEELGMRASQNTKIENPNVPENFKKVFSAIGFEASSIEDLASVTKKSMPELSHQLLHLQLLGLIEELPGKNYRRLS